MEIKGETKRMHLLCNMGSLSFQRSKKIVSKIQFYQKKELLTKCTVDPYSTTLALPYL